MSDARLAAGVWVSAYLTRLRLADIPAYVLSRGDASAGAVIVKCARLDGTAQLYSREWDYEADCRFWQTIADDAESAVDAMISRQRSFDPDLWVIEIESRAGRTLLDEEGMA